MQKIRWGSNRGCNVRTVFLALILIASSASPAATKLKDPDGGGVEKNVVGQNIGTVVWTSGGFVAKPDPCEGGWDTVTDGLVVHVRRPVEGSDPDDPNPEYEERVAIIDSDKSEESGGVRPDDLPVEERPVVQGDNARPVAGPKNGDDVEDYDSFDSGGVEGGRLQDGDSLDILFPSETEDLSDGNGGFWTAHTGYGCGENDETWTAVTPTSSHQLIPAVIEEAKRRLHNPELTLKPFDVENDWTYVQVPLDFRTTNQSTETVIFTADTGGPEDDRKWITVEATPDKLIYESGDKNAEKTKTVCSASQATETAAPYDPKNPGECSYTYQNASSTAPNGKHFKATLSLTWNVTYTSSDGPGTINVAPTQTTENVAIAEIKAVNIPNTQKTDS